MDPDAILTVDQLAEALYEGTPHLQNLAEKLARQHGKAEALCFFQMQADFVKEFWRDIAQQLINHAKEWEVNDGSCCILSQKEIVRLKIKYASHSTDLICQECNQPLVKHASGLRYCSNPKCYYYFKG